MERLTYFSYRNGYDPALLPLGSLALEYSNPRLYKPFVNKSSIPPAGDWAHHDPRTNCLLRTQTKKSGDADVGLKGLLSFTHSRSGTEDIIVVGAEGSKVEIIDPDEYFKEVTLKTDRARFWLESRLTVSNELVSLATIFTRSPTIWLLTGQYLIKDSKSFNVTSAERKSGGKAQVPIIEPSGIAALLGVKIGASINFADGSEFTAGADYPGNRIWAAQWQRVDAKYMAVKRWHAQEQGNRLKLLDVLSPGNQRAGDDNKNVVEVRLSGCDVEWLGVQATGAQGNVLRDDNENVIEVNLSEISEGSDGHMKIVDLPEKYWTRFNQELENLVDDYPEFEDLLVEG